MNHGIVASTRLQRMSGSSGSNYSSELQAIITYADANGIEKPSAATLAALDVYIKAMVADGSWSITDTHYVFAYNNSSLSSFARINLKNPGSNTVTLVNAPIYGVGGFTPNGTSSYGDLNYNPSTQGINYTQNSAAFGCYIRTIPTVGLRVMGTMGSNNNEIIYVSLNTQRINSGLSLTGGSVDYTGIGYKAINRSDAANVQCYVGLTRSTRTATSAALVNSNFTFGRTQSGFSNSEYSMTYTSGNLSETQHNNIRNNHIAYLTAIGL